MSQTAQTTVAVIGIDIGKNAFHIVGHDERGAIVLRQLAADFEPLHAVLIRHEQVLLAYAFRARRGRARLHVSAVVRYRDAEVRRSARIGRMIAVAALMRELARKGGVVGRG